MWMAGQPWLPYRLAADAPLITSIDAMSASLMPSASIWRKIPPSTIAADGSLPLAMTLDDVV